MCRCNYSFSTGTSTSASTRSSDKFSMSTFRRFWCLFFVFCFVSGGVTKPLRIKREGGDDEEVLTYLTRFGYLPPSLDGAFALRTQQSLHSAVATLQAYAGLPITGRADSRTRRLMRAPRCGVPDRAGNSTRAWRRRRRRFTLQGQKWPFTNLTWSLRSKNPNLDTWEVRKVISKALEVWSRHSKLYFTEVDSDRANILIHFYSGTHGDNFPFDGRGVILAHAFFPNNGESIAVHFDADENWTTDPTDEEGTNLFNVAAHEFGHSLGLSHSSVEDALMYPWYKDMENGFDYELPDDDKLAIQQLYGAREDRQWERIPQYQPPTTTTTTTTTTLPPPTPRRPRPHVPYNPNEHPHRYPNSNHRPNYRPVGYPGYPGRPTEKRPPDWRPEKKPMHPDKKPYFPRKHYTQPPRRAPVTYAPPTRRWYVPPTPKWQGKEKESAPPPDQCEMSYDSVAVIRRDMFIFKDAYFWRINETGLVKGSPFETVRLWTELPRDLSSVDAVYERPDNRIVFFIGDRHWVFFGNSLEPGYPRPLTDLGLPPTLKKLDGAMVWGHNGQTFFFSGNEYWRFDEKIGKVELDYPRDVAMWQGIGTDIDAVFQYKDGVTYFFKGKGFWKFDDRRMRVEQPEQKPSGPYWMGCSNNLEGDDNRYGNKLPYKFDGSGTSASKAQCMSCCISLYLMAVMSISLKFLF